jgi:prepilin-type N-terminal cleavage/methylation domain-containing protein
MTASRKAFTLLELAIVVVIIGLLSGVIVAGKSYIRNASLTSTISEAKFYQNAFNQFQTRYQALPGDFRNASTIWSAALNGSGNNFIDANDERFKVFQHLSLAGFIEGSYTGVAGSAGASAALLGRNIPEAPVSNVGYHFFSSSGDGFLTGDTSYYWGQYGVVLAIGRMIPNTNTLPLLSFLSPREAFQLDEKFDDGRPGIGWIRTRTAVSLPNCVSNNAYTDQVNASYLAAGTADACYLLLTNIQ